MGHKLEDIIDIALLQDLQDKLNAIYSFPSAIIDIDGKILTAVAWQDICTKFHRTNPQCEKECIKSDQYILEHLHEAKPAVSYQCPHGLVDNATPIIIGGKHLGNFFTGQFFLEKPDLDFFKKQAKQYGFDENAYLEAVNKVPIWTREKLAQYLDFIKGFIEIIASIGLKNLREIETNKILKESEFKYHTLFENSSNGIVIIDPKTTAFIEFNEQVCKQLGYSREEFAKLTISDVEVEETREEIQQRIKQVIETGSADFETKQRTKQGDIRNIHVSAHFIDISNKKVYHCIWRDITESKKNVIELILAKEKAEENEKKYKLLYNNTPVMLHSVDMRGNINSVNDYWLEVLGYERSEVIGAQSIIYLTEQSKQVYKKNISELIKTGTINNLEAQAVKKNGEIVDLLVSSKMIYNNAGIPIQTMTNLVDITERKNKERELFESRIMQKAIIDSTSDLIWSVDAQNFGLLSFNKSLYNYFFNDRGLQIKAGDSPEELFPPGEFVQKWHNLYNKAIMEGSYTQEYSAFSGKRMLELSFNLLKRDNIIFGISVFGKDITERKQTEKLLKDNNSRLELAMKVANMAWWEMDIITGRVKFDPRKAEMLGYSPEEFNHYKDFMALVHPDDCNKAMDAMKKHFEGENEKYEIEYRIATNTGNYKWFYDIGTIVQRDSKGMPLVVTGLVIDITERKNIEESFSENLHMLHDSQAVAHIGAYITNLTATEFEENAWKASPEIYKIFGIDKSYPHTLAGWVGFIHPDSREELLAYHYKVVVNKERFDKEYKIIRINDGAERWVQGTGEIEYNNLMNPIRMLGTIQDITERKQIGLLLQEKNEKIEVQNEEFAQINEELVKINNELLVAKEKAEESDRLKTAFLQNMSHEIRTPMNAIMGFSGLLAKNYNDKPKLEKFSTIINQRCNDLLDIINDILDIAKIESGQLSINMEVCNLNDLFSELKIFFTEQTKNNGKQQIKFNLQAFENESNLTIITDIVKLRQIFINLISNAYKFTETGSIEGGCRFDTNRDLLFFVSDTGIGIPPDKQQIIFERFAQIEHGPNRIYGGTGLGLSIVKGLVGLLGGELFLESELGKGSTFSFTIPYKTAQEFPNSPIFIQESKELNFSNKTILIVEDDKYNTEYINEILSGTGLNTLFAAFGKEAVEISITKSVDLVLMDIRLPDINGYEATRKIKQYKPNLKIIAQTAYASHDERQKALDAGCDDYISKPTKHDTLLNMIHKHLS